MKVEFYRFLKSLEDALGTIIVLAAIAGIMVAFIAWAVAPAIDAQLEYEAQRLNQHIPEKYRQQIGK